MRHTVLKKDFVHVTVTRHLVQCKLNAYRSILGNAVCVAMYLQSGVAITLGILIRSSDIL